MLKTHPLLLGELVLVVGEINAELKTHQLLLGELVLVVGVLEGVPGRVPAGGPV